MNLKRIFLSAVMIIVLIAIIIPTKTFADSKMFLGIKDLRENNVPNMGYAIGQPGAGGHIIWNIIKWDSQDANTYKESNMYCLNPAIGMGSNEGNFSSNAKYEYDTSYDMKKDRTTVKNLSSITEKEITLDDGTKISNYDAILALGDLLYLPGVSTENEKNELINIIKSQSTLESEIIDDYPINDDDINAIQQAAFWYFTNYGEEKYDKLEANDSWIWYRTENQEYNNLTSYNSSSTHEGAYRAAQANTLYRYLINTAKQNASKYAITSESNVPAVVKTDTLNYTESGNKYIIGPIEINETENNVLPYTIDFIVKNNDAEISSFGILDSNKNPTTKKIKDLVNEEFYISVDKTSIDNLSIDININYNNTDLNLWTKIGDVGGTQPILEPSRTLEKIPKKLSFTPDSKTFDLALRKYITKITSNGVTKVLTDTTDTRAPKVEESVLSTDTTASYKHRKDPVVVETGNIVTYEIRIYNEGEKAGRATQVIDQLPAGLKFSRVVGGNFDADSSYNYEGDNKLILNRKANNTTNLPAYETDNFKKGIGFETIEIECEVMATADSKNKTVLTNIAWISEEYDAETDTPYSRSEIGYDRDSAPGAHPEYNKGNMSNYHGHDDNKSVEPKDSNYFYKGQQDDDDFEKLVLNPKEFDLRLKKYISAINGDSSKGKTITSTDTTKLANKTSTDAEFELSKNVVAVKYGDYVTYTFKVYNEGDINGYVTKLTDNIPLGLQFVQAKNDGKTITIYSYTAEDGITSEDKEVDSDTYNLINRNNAEWTIDKANETVKTDTYDGDTTPSISLDVEGYLGENRLLNAYKASEDINKDGSTLDFVDLTVVLRVSEKAELNKVIRNEAAITGHKDENGNTTIIDRDSQPENWPGKDDHTKYQDDEDYDNIILKPFDLALRKFIVAVSDNETIEDSEWLKTGTKYTREPRVDTSRLNTTENGTLITTATYEHPKQALEVKKGNIVVYMLRVYNEGDIAGYATEIKDHLPSNLEYVDGEFNRQRGWSVSKDGRTVTTRYLENQLIKAAQPIDGGSQPYSLAFKEVQIMCRVKDTAKVDEKITNIADITEFKDENKQPITDRDSQEDNVNTTEGNKPEYKDIEINRGDEYIPGQQDDDDFEKVVIPRFDLALRKQITSIYNNFNKKETKYNDRYAKLDKTQNNTIYNYYDVDSNIPTVVENDIVTYSIRVYNEGKVDGTATWVTDRLPSGLQYLPDDEINKEYGWKAYKQSTANYEKAVKIGEKYYEEVAFDSNDIYMYATEYLKDTTIKSYTGEGEATYGEVFMTTRVKAKSEVANGVEYKLRNIAEIGDDDNDDDDSTPGDESKWKDQDDVDVEDLKLVEFDLALRKWVTQAIVTDSKGQTVTETGHQPYDDPEQVVKVELHRRKLNEVTVKFRYSIRVINEGDIAGYAKEVTDYIPQGLRFVAEDNPGWTDEGNNVISTTLLENTLLQPGEFADVEVLLTWVNNENNMGVMVNTAEISKDYNEYGVPDRDSIPDNKKPGEDDIDDAPVMLSISTGQVRIYFALGFVVLITIAGGVVLIKKYVL